jgi:hypothetical protein
VSTAILSGDGSTVFVVTNSGHLLKIDTTSGVSTLIANGAEIQQIQGGAVAGSLNTMQGLGLADARRLRRRRFLPVHRWEERRLP